MVLLQTRGNEHTGADRISSRSAEVPQHSVTTTPMAVSAARVDWLNHPKPGLSRDAESSYRGRNYRANS